MKIIRRCLTLSLLPFFLFGCQKSKGKKPVVAPVSSPIPLQPDPPPGKDDMDNQLSELCRIFFDAGLIVLHNQGEERGNVKVSIAEDGGAERSDECLAKVPDK